ncbi:ATP-binding protein [Alcaligenes faecalis]|uniref:ATP-binding protein n=2 Tax=Alcaligenes faecalis TaxID=511 RepID=UPI0021629E0D|nr:ATP-binding protein [Alcaligenes faecalis]
MNALAAGKDLKVMIEDEIRRIQAGVAADRAKTISHSILSRAAIPPRFADRRLSNYQPTCPEAAKALQVAQQYADSFEQAMQAGRSLIFIGNVGAGKTHLAVGIAHEVMEQGYSALFTSVMGAVRSIKETYGRRELTESQAIARLVEPDLLILDEVGVQFSSDTERLYLFEILNGRYENMRPTIVISNLDMAGIKECLGQRVYDRLREGDGRAVSFVWESYRGRP